MPSIIVQCPIEDELFRSQLEKNFTDAVTVAEIKSFDGFECLQIIVEITLPLAPFLVDFLIGSLRESAKRVVITPEGEIVLTNYSSEEAKIILENKLLNGK